MAVEETAAEALQVFANPLISEILMKNRFTQA